MSVQGYLLAYDRLALYFAVNINIYDFPKQIYKGIYWTENQEVHLTHNTEKTENKNK